MNFRQYMLGLGATLTFCLCLVSAPTVLSSCTAAQTNTVIKDITPAAACIVNALADGGIAQPMLIVAECTGTVIEDVVAVIQSLLANQPAAADAAGKVGMSPAREAYLRDMLAKAQSAAAAKQGP